MAPVPPLFALEIPGSQGKGHFTCTQPAPQVYLVSFASPPDNRLVPAFNATFLLALDIIEQRLPRGVVVTTSAIAKFYSNGLDFEAASADRNFFPHSLYPLWRRLLTYPMPTVALMNGHAFAGGLMTAMAHDYRVMNPSKGFVCLNELDFGAVLQPTMMALFRVKLNVRLARDMVLESKRYPAPEALKEGILDATGGLDETMALIKERKLVVKAQGSSYGELKVELYHQIVRDIDNALNVPKLRAERDADRHRREAEAKKKVDASGVAVGKPKL